jgi:hypothetical protein
MEMLAICALLTLMAAVSPAGAADTITIGFGSTYVTIGQSATSVVEELAHRYEVRIMSEGPNWTSYAIREKGGTAWYGNILAQSGLVTHVTKYWDADSRLGVSQNAEQLAGTLRSALEHILTSRSVQCTVSLSTLNEPDLRSEITSFRCGQRTVRLLLHHRASSGLEDAQVIEEIGVEPKS